MAAVKSQYSQDNRGRPLDEVIEELHDRVAFLETWLRWDEALREKNPALQDLYEKYQSTKNLLK